jgi:hypothetical protein
MSRTFGRLLVTAARDKLLDETSKQSLPLLRPDRVVSLNFAVPAFRSSV